MITIKSHDVYEYDFTIKDIADVLHFLGFIGIEDYSNGKSFSSSFNCHFVIKESRTIEERINGNIRKIQTWTISPLQDTIKTTLMKKVIDDYFEDLVLDYIKVNDSFWEKADEFNTNFTRLMKECDLYGDEIASRLR